MSASSSVGQTCQRWRYFLPRGTIASRREMLRVVVYQLGPRKRSGCSARYQEGGDSMIVSWLNRPERSEVVVCETGIDAAGAREAAAAPLSTACVRRLNEVKEVDQNSASW